MRLIELRWLAILAINKTIDIFKEHFYWPKMGGHVYKVISAYSIYHKAKSQFHQGLYTLLLLPLNPWGEVSKDFIVVSLEPEKGGIQSWLWWIGFLRWLNLLHVIRLMIQAILMRPILKMSLGSMVFLNPLSLIMIQSFYPTFGGVCRSY